jgi:hypothetical protein
MAFEICVSYRAFRAGAILSIDGLETKSAHVRSPCRQSRRSVLDATPGRKQKED